MLITEPMPYAEALSAIARRTPVGSVLNSAEWAEVPLALRDRAFFSAQQTNVTFLAKAKQGVEGLVAGKTDRATQRLGLRRIAESLGMAPAGGDGSGGLGDIGSDARLNLILDTQLKQAQGYGNFVQGNEPTVLEQWPAQELIDTNPGNTGKRRNWAARWLAAGGSFFGGRMIALKSDPIWAELSRFGTPYPPFDFNSYWDVQDVDYDTAVEAGVLKQGEAVESAVPDFNEALEASLPESGSEYARLLQATFGDQLDVSPQGKLIWQGTRVSKLFEGALADPQFKRSLSLGTGTTRTRELARAAGVELKPEAVLNLDADHIRKVWRDHGPGGEKRGDQRPLAALDFELLPHVWREPDAVRAGDEPGDLVFEKKLLDRSVVVTWKPAPKSGALRLQTFYVKKEEGGTR
jgi:hypothetical protein